MSTSESFTWQQKWIAIAPKPFSLLSLFGSSCILIHILRSKERRSQVYHRIMIGLSAYDIIVSFTMFWGTWAIPVGSPGVYLASGTEQTCNAQAFLQQLGLAVPIYTAELAIYFVLVVSFNWKERQLKKIEILYHVIPSALGFSSSIVGIATDSFANGIYWCWYSESAQNLRFGFFYGILWACILLVCILMTSMYVTVLMQERRVKKYQYPNVNAGMTSNDTAASMPSVRTPKQQRREKKASNSRKIAIQAIYYSGSFLLAWVFGSLTRIYEMVNKTQAPFILEAMFTTFTPLQGFFNCFIYFRPKYLRFRREHPDFSIRRFICDCGGLISYLQNIRYEAARSYRVRSNPAEINDTNRPDRSSMMRFATKRFSQRFTKKRSKNSDLASNQSSPVKNGNITVDDQHCGSSNIKVVDKGDENEGETNLSQSTTRQLNRSCLRNSTVRFADFDIEEEKVEE